MSSKQKVRSLFISDVHLANPNSQAKKLYDFLNNIEADYLFLLGDIVDLWKLSSHKGRWYKEHELVLKQIMEFARSGTRIIYIPGNHDPFFRHFVGSHLGPVEVHEEYIHSLATEQTLLLIHGDRFDDELYMGDAWHVIGEWLYEGIVSANRWLNVVRHKLDKPYWSLSVALKMNSKKARHYIERFENLAVNYARSQGTDGVICGHIHQSKLTYIDGMIYGNDGDWVETCSALVETQEGYLELLSVNASHDPVSARLATA
ncbi:UDP-2,3-diacylglucosamine diphosphatase [Reinekea sp. G2M2-21]|uniref:UDP-2,3-diacylglucosamine diphosphatase n=1 Tax=Reinekea sp. G2M2-21 TaxID=2788942 RepID=UPI0018A9DD61|nr:UDP-2,3-diacylglucosamine diphosphatase [Reinekea sp. G2M2-21]